MAIPPIRAGPKPRREDFQLPVGVADTALSGRGGEQAGLG